MRARGRTQKSLNPVKSDKSDMLWRVFALLVLVACTTRCVAIEEEIDIEGVPLDGGASERKYEEEQKNKETFRSHVPKNTVRYCNDQKYELDMSIIDIIKQVLPDDEMLSEVKDISDPALAQLKVLLANVGESVASVGAPILDAAAALKEKLPDLPDSPELQKLYEYLQAGSSTLINATTTEIPFLAIISDGYFILKTSDVSKVKLVQRNYESINAICSSQFITTHLPFINSALCRCWSINSSPYEDGDKFISHDNQWCSRDLSQFCDSNSAECIIAVDPLRYACIEAVPGYASDLRYYRKIPLLRIPVEVNLKQKFEDLGKYIIGLHDYTAILGQPFVSMLSFFGDILDKILTFIPLYAANFVGGIFLLTMANEFASSVLFQYVLAATFGAILAVVWVGLIVYRTAENALKGTLSALAPGLGFLFVGSSFYFLQQPAFRQLFMTSTIYFWNEGLFDIKWLGKAYFITSIVVSVTLTYVFGLFQPKTTSGYVLESLIKMLGMLLLAQSTSNVELSSVVVLYGLCQEHISYYLFYSGLVYASYKQQSHLGTTYRNMNELQPIVTENTRKEVEKLRLFLQNNPSERQKYVNRLSQGDKGEVATNLTRFTHGLHHLANTPLVPGTKSWQEAGLDDMEAMGLASDNDFDDDEDVAKKATSQKKKPKSSLFSWLVFITRIIVVFVLIFVLVVVFQIQQKHAITSLLDSPYYKSIQSMASKAIESILSVW
jgi:hypothetical protein